MSEIILYQTPDNQTAVEVRFDGETVWLNQYQLADLFATDRTSILKHLKNIYAEGELSESATCAKIAQVRQEGKRSVRRNLLNYNLDAILSIGYRVNSKRGTQFRQWATQRLNDYLVQGYVVNEKRLAEKEQQVVHLKTGIKILSRALGQQAAAQDNKTLQAFASGLRLLDDFDHEQLDVKGRTTTTAKYPPIEEYLAMINTMKSHFASDVFAKTKDDSFESSVRQIQQSFAGEDLYGTVEEKAAMLLYLIVKNHSFVDGNKRIAAACFLHFLDKNGLLFLSSGQALISNEALAALTLFVATSKPDEMETIKQFIMSVLNRSE